MTRLLSGSDVCDPTGGSGSHLNKFALWGGFPGQETTRLPLVAGSAVACCAGSAAHKEFERSDAASNR